MDTSDFRRRSEEMGGEVAQADQQFTKHVGQAFSGEVGRLGLAARRSGPTAGSRRCRSGRARVSFASHLGCLAEAGSGLADLLGSPENIAQAVIMAEILRRPNSFS